MKHLTQLDFLLPIALLKNSILEVESHELSPWLKANCVYITVKLNNMNYSLTA